MNRPTIRQTLALLTLGLALSLSTPARADLILNTPAGLNPGDSFRFVFLTVGGTTASATDIADYNTFVNNDAASQAGGVVRHGNTPLTWAVIGSTATVAAVSNIGTFGVPVFLSTGVRVANTDGSGTSGLFNPTFLNPLLASINVDLSGNTIPGTPYVYTGSTSAGASSPSGVLGDGYVTMGIASRTDDGYLDLVGGPNGNVLQLYGISQVLTIPVPEPGTLAGAALGCGLALLAGTRRRRA